MKVRTTVALAALICVAAPAARAQEANPVTALLVEVTISRYQGEKRLSSVPHSLAVTPDNKPSSLRVGGEVPIPSATFTPANKPDAQPVRSVNYRDIGTNIDVSAAAAPDGRYRISISLVESSVYPPSEAKNSIMSAPASIASGAPAFRSLRTSNTVSLKDGQSIEFIAATDRVSGDVARVSVKLTVVP